MADYKHMRTADAIAEIRRLHGCSEEEARFILAIERGEIGGDVLAVDSEGNDLHDPPGPLLA